MTTLAAAGQDTILMSSIFAFAANFTSQKKTQPQTQSGSLYNSSERITGGLLLLLTFSIYSKTQFQEHRN